MFDRIKSLDRHKALNLVLLFALVVAIPLTVVISQQVQDLRQRASGPSATPPGTTANVALYINPVTKTVAPGTTFTAALMIDPSGNQITGVDVTLSYDKTLLTLTSFGDSGALNDVLINKSDSTNGIFHFSAVDTSNLPLTAITQLGTLTFTAAASISSTKASDIGYQNVQITGLNSPNAIPSVNGVSSFTIAVPTPTLTITPIPPTGTPIPPSPTPTPTPMPLAGDINGDRSVDILDYNIWRNEFLGLNTTKRSDLNHDGVIDLLDFNIWRMAFK